MQRKQEKKNEWQKKAFRAEKNNSELKEKGHEPSRAEKLLARAMTRTNSDSSLLNRIDFFTGFAVANWVSG